MRLTVLFCILSHLLPWFVDVEVTDSSGAAAHSVLT